MMKKNNSKYGLLKAVGGPSVGSWITATSTEQTIVI